MAKKEIGLLVMAYGTPYKPEDIVPYYTAIRHGRRPSEAQIADLKRRYEAIGGSSPLAELTRQQAEALEEHLNRRQSAYRFKAYLGLKYIHPYIEDAVKAMSADQVDQAVALVLAPHYSRFSVQAYTDRAIAASEKAEGPAIHQIRSWYRQPRFIQYWADRVRDVIENIPVSERENTVVIFSAHSLPEKILKNGDPYPDQVTETAEAIAAEAGVQNYAQAWQSAGNTGDPWLGPDILDKIRQLHRDQGYRHFIFCPIGFVAEHLEVLYDNDQECKSLVEELGAVYHRPQMPDTDPLFIAALSEAVLEACKGVTANA